MSAGSSGLRNGGGGESLDEPLEPHDIIQLFISNRDRIFEISAALYIKGYSLRDIESQTLIPKSTIKDALEQFNFPRRNFKNCKNALSEMANCHKPSTPPYGYDYLDGQLVVAPKEYRIVARIIRMWNSGIGTSAIIEQLNLRNYTTRHGQKWRKQSVIKVIKREKLKEEANKGLKK